MSHSPHPASIECIFGYVIPQRLQEASVQSTEAVPKRGDAPSLEKDGEIVGADCGLVGNDLPLKQLRYVVGVEANPVKSLRRDKIGPVVVIAGPHEQKRTGDIEEDRKSTRLNSSH